LIELLTLEGKRPTLVQEILPGGIQGDKRLLLIDGQLVGAVKRLSKADDHRGNVHVGGLVAAASIDDDDKKIANTLGPALKRDGLLFVGIDVIDGKLIEVNVTSPTLVQEHKRLTGIDLAARLFDVIESKRK
jgi:glutathione synthase